MPHTNRKKTTESGFQSPKSLKNRNINRQKPGKVEDDNGWTHIIGERKIQVKLSETTEKMDFIQTGDFEINGFQYVNKTIEEMNIEHERYQKQWETSTACRELKERLLERTEGKDKVDNVVCLGLGSLQNASNHFCRTSHVQLAALSTIMEVLGVTNIRKIAQDPVFTELDQKFLKSIDYEVTETPVAFEQTNSKSLVYAVHCYPNIYDTISKGPRPAMLIGNDLSSITQWGSASQEEMMKSIEILSQDYEEILEFPRFRHDFSDTKIYSAKMGDLEVVEDVKMEN